MAGMVSEVSKPWVIIQWAHHFNIYLVLVSDYAFWHLHHVLERWISFKKHLCWQVQYLGTRGQYFGPPLGPCLRRKVSSNYSRTPPSPSLLIVSLCLTSYFSVHLLLSQSGEAQSSGLSQERSETPEVPAAGNDTFLVASQTSIL